MKLIHFFLAVFVGCTPAIAGEDNLFLSCRTTAVRLCKGTPDDEQCRRWMPLNDSSGFSITRVKGRWEITKKFTAELVLTDSDEEGYMFEYVSPHDNSKAFLALSRVTAAVIDATQPIDGERIETQATCKKLDRLF